MSWGTAALLILVVVLFLLQGVSLILSKTAGQRARAAGFLAVVTALLATLGSLLATSEHFILGRELGLLMADGSTAIYGLMVLIVSLCGLGACGLRVARPASSRFGGAARHCLGAFVAVLAITRITLLNPGDPAFSHVYIFDLWWPPTLMWIAFCLVECVAAVLRVDRVRDRLCFTSAATAGLAIWAIERSSRGFVYADWQTPVLWNIVVACSLTLFLETAASRLLLSHSSPRAWFRGVPVAAAASLALTFAWCWGIGQPPAASLLWLAWGACLGGLIVAGVIKVLRIWGQTGIRIPDFGRLGRLDDSLAFIALLSIGAVVADLLYFSYFGPGVHLLVVLIASVTLFELTGGGPLRLLWSQSWVKELREAETLVGGAATMLKPVVEHTGKFWSSFRTWFEASSWPSLVLKTLVGLAILVALSEIPNHGKTIIVPFTTLGLKDSEKDLGRLISDRAIHTLGSLRREFQPETVLPEGNASTLAGKKGRPGTFVTAADEGGAEAQVQSGDLEVGGVHVPVSLLLVPVRAPMRWLLRVNEVHGVVHREETGLVVIANSSTESWRVAAKPIQVANERPETGNKGESAPVTGTPRPPAAEDKSLVVPAEVSDLADELAYQVVSTDPSFGELGMTHSSQAMRPFREGLAAWRIYKDTRNFKQLQTAITKFEEAAQTDPKFALAHYRLGAAFLEDASPARAIDSFHTSLAANPRFASAYVLLAQALYYFSSYGVNPAVNPTYQRLTTAEDEARAREARDVWHRLTALPATDASPVDRAAGFSGLGGAIDLGQAGSRESYLRYFYFQRALSLLSTVSLEARTEGRQAESYVLGEIGSTLQHMSQTDGPQDLSTDWSCDDDHSEWVLSKGELKLRSRTRWVSPYARAALHYYKMAFVRNPDNAVIGCNAALAELSLGNDQAMKDLALSSAAHFSIADNLRLRAAGMEFVEQAVPYYRKALDEFQRAIETSGGNNLEAMNGYAYTFWQWRVLWPAQKPPYGPDRTMASAAERYAREAVRIVEHKIPKDDNLFAIVKSTLGETLLAQGRPHEAREHLQSAINEVGDSNAVDEIRWDLAQAELCASFNDRRLMPRSDGHDWTSDALRILEWIRARERGAALQPFLANSSFLNAGWPTPACQWLPEYAVGVASASQGWIYELVQPNAQDMSYSPCSWLAFRVRAADRQGQPAGGMALHVWGGGIDENLTLNNDVTWDRPRPFPQAATDKTHHYYFAQLESLYGPASDIIPLDTFGSGARLCPGNLISMTFNEKPRP